MRVSSEGLALIRRFEGFSAVPYRCPAGFWTVGYGRRIAGESMAQPVGQDLADRWLQEDAAAAGRAVGRLVTVPLTQGQFDALVSFTFNLGAGALERSTLRQVLNRREYDEVPRQMMRWVYAGGRVLRGLVLRRQAEALLYIS